MAWEFLAVAARSVLALVFLSAGFLKLAGASPVAETMAAFGFRGPRWSAASRFLPAVEIVVGLALVWPLTALAGSLAAALLLGAFTAVMVSALRRGEAPPCNCFGAVTAAPISRRTVARNVVLLAVALVAVLLTSRSAGPSLVAWSTGIPRLTELLVLATLLLALAVLALGQTLASALATQQSLQRSLAALEHIVDESGAPRVVRETPPRDDSLPVGAPAPAFSLNSGQGTAVTLARLLEAGLPVLFVSASATCGPCRALVPKLLEWAGTHRERLTIVIAYAGGTPDDPSANRHAHILVADETVNQAFRLRWTPAAVLIDAAGRMASPVASGAESIAALVTLATTTERVSVESVGARLVDKVPGLPIGSEAPALPGVDISSPRLVLFWRFGCPHCRGMAPALERWVADRATRTDAGPEVVVVNWSGEATVGLDSVAVVHDEAGELARQFGAQGTPSAVLVGADGRIASTVGVGAPNVFALLGAQAGTA